MSQENVESVRRTLWEGDVVPLVREAAAWEIWCGEVAAIFEPNCGFAWIAPGQRVDVTGLDALRRFGLDWLDAWESVYVEVEQIFGTGDMVVLVARHHGQLAGGRHDAGIEQTFGAIYHLRDGKVAQVDNYTNRGAALEAAGVRG